MAHASERRARRPPLCNTNALSSPADCRAPTASGTGGGVGLDEMAEGVADAAKSTFLYLYLCTISREPTAQPRSDVTQARSRRLLGSYETGAGTLGRVR